MDVEKPIPIDKLAKSHVLALDSGIHELVSHW
jgi:hypothetical protein